MTIEGQELTQADVGREVWYDPVRFLPVDRQRGVLHSWTEHTVFVRYYSRTTGLLSYQTQATRPEDLEWGDSNKTMEVNP